MSTPFLGELKLMSFNFPPKGWALCNGQLLPINQNQALFALLGTMYGGNGQTNFALPDLRGRSAMHVGAGFIQGQIGGQEAQTITASQMPAHTHFVSGTSAAGNTGNPTILATADQAYNNPVNLVPLPPATVTNVGGSQAHTNMQPYLVLSWCIALQGIFPSRN